MSIQVVVVMRCDPEAREGMVEELSAVAAQVRTEDGCEQYALHTSGRDGVVLLESWRDKDALRVHSEAPSMAAFQAVAERVATDGPTVHVLRPVTATTAG